jgi:hypothetical protein
VGICSFGGSVIQCINGRAFVYTCYKINKVIANEQGFKLSRPLRKSRGDEFFVNGCGSIDCDDG